MKVALELIKHHTAPRLLDVGCGDGSLALELGKRLAASETWGLDLSKPALREAKCKGIVAVLGDGDLGLPFQNSSFDLVYAGELIEHLRNQEGFLREVNRVLRPGGFLLLTTPNRQSYIKRLSLYEWPFFKAAFTKGYRLAPKHYIVPAARETLRPHVRELSLSELSDLLSSSHLFEFRRAHIQGASLVDKYAIDFMPFPKSISWILCSIDAILSRWIRLSPTLVALAQKPPD